MTIEQLEGIKIEKESKAWALLVRVVEEINKQGMKIIWIQNVGGKGEYDELKYGEKFIGVKKVYRSNATQEDVSVKIEVWQKGNNWSASRIGTVKVPKDASDKVIRNRIEKAKALMNN